MYIAHMIYIKYIIFILLIIQILHIILSIPFLHRIITISSRTLNIYIKQQQNILSRIPLICGIYLGSNNRLEISKSYGTTNSTYTAYIMYSAYNTYTLYIHRPYSIYISQTMHIMFTIHKPLTRHRVHILEAIYKKKCHKYTVDMKLKKNVWNTYIPYSTYITYNK